MSDTTPDPHEPFRLMLSQSRHRLAEVTARRDHALEAASRYSEEMVHLRRVIVSIAAMLGEATEMESIGITEAVRTVMTTANVPLKLRNVCDRLAHAGFDANAQQNLAASVQSVLNRLAEKKEILREEVPLQGGKTVMVYTGLNVTKEQRKQTITAIRNGA